MDLERKLLSKEELKSIPTCVISTIEDDGFGPGWPREEETYRFMQYHLPRYNKTFLVFGNEWDTHADIADRFFKFLGFGSFTQRVKVDGYFMNIPYANKSDCRLIGAGFCEIKDGTALFKDKSKSYDIGPDRRHLLEIGQKEKIPYKLFVR